MNAPQLMHIDNISSFSLVRYEPNDILLVDKRSRQPYTFHQLPDHIFTIPDLTHPYLLRPTLYKNGAIFLKGSENLSSLLQHRMRDYSLVRYSQEELLNTFSPVVECVEYLHQKNIIHGSLSLQSVIFFESGQILVKDWLFRSQNNILYDNKTQPSKKSDLQALGKMISLAATLLPLEDFNKKSLEEIIAILLDNNYNTKFCEAIIALTKGIDKYLGSILSLMGGETNLVDLEIQKVLQNAQKKLRVKKQEQEEKKKKVQIKKQKKLKETEEKQKSQQQIKKQSHVMESKINNAIPPSLQGSPTKKFNITAPNKKLIRLEDVENKKLFNEEVKKRQIEKITKIIERSNAFVNELMARKNNDKKVMGSKMNTSMYDTGENSVKKSFIKESPKISSPNKRLRSISKKK